LKQFSENLLSKTIALEKEIQQLSYQEKVENIEDDKYFSQINLNLYFSFSFVM
jgi:hypothetical protein